MDPTARQIHRLTVCLARQRLFRPDVLLTVWGVLALARQGFFRLDCTVNSIILGKPLTDAGQGKRVPSTNIFFRSGASIESVFACLWGGIGDCRNSNVWHAGMRLRFCASLAAYWGREGGL